MSTTSTEPQGLRDRKKAKRRGLILRKANTLFARNGIDPTTMADIASSVDVSVPTLFNYFGSKDGILISLLTDGEHEARSAGNNKVMREDVDMATVLVDLFLLFAERSLKIADKRIWRYAEAAAIRHPTTALAMKYTDVDQQLQRSIAKFMSNYDIRLRSGKTPDYAFLAQLFFDTWNTAFFRLIKNDDLTLDQHREEVEARFLPLAELIFDTDFQKNPKLKRETAPQDLSGSSE